MTIYEKLAEARLRFLSSGAKKSGRNAFAKYEYFELSDILPVINRAAKEIGFCCVVRFGQEEATLEVVDSAKPEDRIVFTSPMATAELKGCHPAQNLGAAQTYIRRYLYLTAFEICESDGLDATAGQANARADAKTPETKMSPAEMQEEIRRVLTATRPDGGLIFTEEEKRDWWSRFIKRPKSTLSLAQMEAAKRGVDCGMNNP